tara:strand:+ start:2764 stop:2865 length:102 start_codon:yes stop_codon:yes gene_type:complete
MLALSAAAPAAALKSHPVKLSDKLSDKLTIVQP